MNAIGRFLMVSTESLPFVLEITVPTNGYAVRLPGSDLSNVTSVNWGDGVIDSLGEHTYSSSGVYDIKIKGVFIITRSINVNFRRAITNIKQWGEGFSLDNDGFYFRDYNGLFNATPIDVPNFSGVTNFSNFFRDSSLVSLSNINDWDVSSVTNMTAVFTNTSFNQDIGNWDTGNVTTFQAMFNNTPFNQDISGWNTSNVTNMVGVFRFNTAFNQDISNWDFSNVTNLSLFMDGKLASDYNPVYYSNLLIKWDLNGLSNVTIGMGGVQYTSLGSTARASLISRGCTITDGGQV